MQEACIFSEQSRACIPRFRLSVVSGGQQPAFLLSEGEQHGESEII
ncbi:hypothetical protein Pvag_pPag30116 (plasmid) [Pantoea vagans C9-1]|nr:hypothetical protein Pvag_pPag30116 [Pantoea vagans C9-1]